MTDQTHDPPGPLCTLAAHHQEQQQQQEEEENNQRPTFFSTDGPSCLPVAPLDRLAARAAARAAAQHCGLCWGVLDECVATLACVHIPVVLDCVCMCGPPHAPDTAPCDKAAAAHACDTVLGLAARAGDILAAAEAQPSSAFEAQEGFHGGACAIAELLAAHTVVPVPVLVVALVYVDRVAGSARVDRTSVHRLFTAAFVVAGKFASDTYNSNGHCARVTGLALAELNRAERALLAATHGALVVEPAEYAAYAAPVAVLARAFEQCGDLTAMLERVVAQAH